MNLTALDLAIIGVPLALVLFVSIYLRRYMRSVADFLAASRCAGRYLIATAGAETGASVMAMIVALETFSRVGWSLDFWNSFTGVFYFFLGLLGIVGYRFRQTRALTFHQFFEVRYSKGVRMYASFLNAFSGCLSFGVQPAVGARFFVYFCGLPETVQFAGMTMPTFVPVMVALMAMSVYFALTGGQISVMVTDCLEGVISSFFYLIIAGFLVCTFSISQLKTAMLSGAAGASYVDPFEIGSRSDLNGWYVFFGLIMSMYWFRGNAWNQGFAAAAKSPHEGRMATILSSWRGFTYGAMSALVALGAFTLLHNPEFASQKALVQQHIDGISVQAIHSQMTMPVALGTLLIPGIKGCFCAVLLFGLLAGQGQQLHNYGCTYLQDVFLPLLKRPLSPKMHVLALKLMVFGVATFACFFSVWFKPMDYLVLAVQLLSTLYLGGIGFVVWGGLYWKKGTAKGAWFSLVSCSLLTALFFWFQQDWASAGAWLRGIFGPGNPVGQYLLNHVDKCPLNGQQLTIIIIAVAGLGYVLVSLLTCRENFNLDELLHRGKYRLKTDEEKLDTGEKRSWHARFLGIDANFTRGDKVLTYATFGWTMFWQIVSVSLLIWTLCVGRLSAEWWFNYRMTVSVGLALALAVPTTLWFTWGTIRDIAELVRTLRTAKRSDADDGTVRGHHNAGDEDITAAEEEAVARK
jgi:Na+/proline symporter